MLRLDSFAHRDALAELIGRWVVNRPRPGDVCELKQIVNFNLYAARLWVDHLARELLRGLHGQEPAWRVARSKGEYKDFAVEHLSYTSPRIEELCARYRRFPEDFYRETPVDGGFYTVLAQGEPMLAACSRVKRFRRVAEKGSRRIVDFLLQRIRESADQLADERAQQLGVSRRLLSSPPEVMAEEFAHAERRVIKGIKQGRIADELPMFSIPDVVGLKLIIEDSSYPRLQQILSGLPCQVEETEFHSGQYNAINIRLAYRLPRQLLLEHPPHGPYLRLFAHRGFDPAEVPGAYRRFVASAEDEVGVEIIVSNFQEYLESEIGQGMHEERVLSQRRHPDYAGHLAANIRYLMEYILGLCRAPGMAEVDEVPIKLWVKYMPDTVEQLIRGLYLGREHFFDTVPDPPG